MKEDTSEYSSSLAPETVKHARERDGHVDNRVVPGGEESAGDTPQGMAGLDRDQVPDGAAGDDRTRYRDTGKGEEPST